MSSTSSNTGEFTYNELMEQYVKATRLIEHLKSQRDRSKRAFDKAMDLVLKHDARIAELEEAQRWRVVADGELPEFGTSILFYDSILERINKGTCTAMNSDNTNLHWFTDDDLFYFGDRSEYITHWMPLPKLPEVQE